MTTPSAVSPEDAAIAEAVKSARDEAFKPIVFPVVLMPVDHPTKKGEFVSGRRFIVREDDGEVLNVVSGKYPLVRHADLFYTLDEAIEKIGLPVLRRSVRSAYHGGYAKVTWDLDLGVSVADAELNDDVKMSIHARNSYNYTSIVGLELGTLRKICTNGALAGHMLKGAQKRHVPSINVPKMIDEISDMLSKSEAVAKAYARLRSVEFTRDSLEKFLEQPKLAVSKSARQAILDYYTIQPDRVKNGGTPQFNSWEAFNAITWYATHKVTSRKEDMKLVSEERLQGLAEQFALGALRSN